jgi:hypothetical protein
MRVLERPRRMTLPCGLEDVTPKLARLLGFEYPSGACWLPLSEITRLLDDLLLYCRPSFNSIWGGTSVADET